MNMDELYTSMYQRFLSPQSTPFNPLELAQQTEEIITREGECGLERKYTDFYSAPVYRGIATGYAAGCCLRCFYCWANWSRDFPDTRGNFYSPEEAAHNLFKAAERGIISPGWKQYRHIKVQKLRLSGCEPTLGKNHLLHLLEYVIVSTYSLFILVTNGMLLGSDTGYVKRLAEFKEKLYVRVSFKAATPEGFEKRTGAQKECYKIPFTALKTLLNNGIYARAAAMTDSRVMPQEERDILLQTLDEIDPESDYYHTLEEEDIGVYDTTMNRIKAYYDADFARELQESLGK